MGRIRDRRQEQRAAEERQRERDKLEADIKSSVSELSLRELRTVKKVANKPEEYGTLISFLRDPF